MGQQLPAYPKWPPASAVSCGRLYFRLCMWGLVNLGSDAASDGCVAVCPPALMDDHARAVWGTGVMSNVFTLMSMEGLGCSVMGRSPDNLVLVLWSVVLALAEAEEHQQLAHCPLSLAFCFACRWLFIFTVHEITETNVLMFCKVGLFWR